jgi:hypothetical protein
MWTDPHRGATALVVEAGSKAEAIAAARAHNDGPGTLPAHAVFVPGG